MSLFGDSKFAVAQSVPELDGTVSRARNNLSIVGGEGNGENIVGVANEATGGGAGGKLPKSEGFVPGCR